MSNTIAFSEKNKGWIHFLDMNPGLMCRLNNQFFTIKDGQLYKHHDKDNPQLNNLYGNQVTAKITTVFNEAPSEDKVFKNMIQEGTRPWKTTIETNLANGVIEAEEFAQIESKWVAHTRKNESSDLTDRVQGIGNIQSIDGAEITFAQLPTLISIGETLYQVNNNAPEQVGVVDDIQGNVITVNTIVTTPINGLFAYTQKNARIQGSEIRGYCAEVTFESDDSSPSELFAVNSNIIKSYIPTEFK